MTVDDARQRALNWLKQGELSAAAIHQRLLSAGHDPSTCDALINQLVANGTIDDARCAESLIQRWTHAGPIAPGELRRRLHEKGVPPDVAAQATELANGNDEITQAMEAAERKMKSLGDWNRLSSPAACSGIWLDAAMTKRRHGRSGSSRPASRRRPPVP